MTRILLLSTLVLIASGCTQQRLLQSITPSDRVPATGPESSYLKAHLLDGQVYVFTRWQISEDGRVRGTGKQFNLERAEVRQGGLTVAIDSVVLFESNRLDTHPAMTGLTLMTTASIGMTVFCVLNPKACFGSCPTFYVSDGQEMILQAEGFSSSVAPVLESSDIDALYRAEATDGRVLVTMTNEALETHVVRRVNLLAVPRVGGERIMATSKGDFWRTGQILAPVACVAPEGDCLKSITAVDGEERFSITDGHDLAAKEIVELTFEDVPAGKLGLVIGSRQTLLTTYLFYQGLAYLGHEAGYVFANLERNGVRMNHPMGAVGQLLGGIEVQIQDEAGRWRTAGVDDETGPIAVDIRMIPLPHMAPGRQKIRLRMTKGHVRLDYVAMAVLEEQVEPLRLQPVLVEKEGEADEGSLNMLVDPARTVVTLPGDSYTLTYMLPQAQGDYELFLESQGYYLEWMRDEWLTEENLSLARELFRKPGKSLRRLASEFKAIEASMEETFWSSRYAQP
jgi:hypothetical protein